jgi:hypothetical protein
MPIRAFDPDKDIRKILETPFWPRTLSPVTRYSRVHDDHDGEFKGHISVIIDQQGDVHLSVDTLAPLRFRTEGGGGVSLRVRTALVILAEAIRLDNETRPTGEE